MQFSVIVTIYNIEEWIYRCIQSILGQTYNDFEIILVDDGSTDRSGKICDEFCEKYPNTFRVIHKENGGPSDARNVGVQAARGEYIIFIDGDDFLKEDALRNMKDAIVNFSKPDILYSNGNFEFSDRKNLFRKNNIVCLEKKENQQFTGKELLRTLLRNQINGWSVWGKAYSREFWVNNGFCFRYRFMEDMDLCYKIYIVAQSVAVIPPYYCYYRGRTGSLLSKFNAENLLTYIDILKQWDVYLTENTLIDEDIKGMIYQRFAIEYVQAVMAKIYYADEEMRKTLLTEAEKLKEYISYLGYRKRKLLEIGIKLIGFGKTCYLLNWLKEMKRRFRSK